MATSFGDNCFVFVCLTSAIEESACNMIAEDTCDRLKLFAVKKIQHSYLPFNATCLYRLNLCF